MFVTHTLGLPRAKDMERLAQAIDEMEDLPPQMPMSRRARTTLSSPNGDHWQWRLALAQPMLPYTQDQAFALGRGLDLQVRDLSAVDIADRDWSKLQRSSEMLLMRTSSK